MNKKKEEELLLQKQQMEIQRVKLPRGKQSIGLIESRLGNGRMRVRCYDGKIRVCRIPGSMKRNLWVRENDIVLVEPWEYGGDDKGDVIYKYRPSQVDWLRKRGYIKEVTVDLEEF